MYREFLPWHTKSVKIDTKRVKQSNFKSSNISILNWNVHKENHSLRWLNEFNHILNHYNPDIALFQEYKKVNSKSILTHNINFGYNYLPNISLGGNDFGLMSASKIDSNSCIGLLSSSVEPIIKTPKLTLLTRYKIEDSKIFTIINCHLINFVRFEAFKKEIQNIEQLIKNSSGALILAGDFNTWSKKRFDLLNQICLNLGLKRVAFDENRTKKLLKRDLDHIFYRDLILNEFELLKDIKSSDHLPQLARFKFI